MCVFAVVEMTPPAIANIDWRVFIIFAVTNALWVPCVFLLPNFDSGFNHGNNRLVYCFFPETRNLELEDIDHIFEKGGITGGVWSSPGGRTVEPQRIRKDVEEVLEREADNQMKDDKS